ncbi:MULTISPECIES: hypothetical protein [Pseudomonas]|uniref:Uncharacterized protein n=1 Tax=Pseudomonas piscis TaxID=2614538 RepID=A0ABY9N9K7_9PSED|nr:MULTISPECIES: hypothetical protein [Pseudomonas]KTC37001.1 hypothetical protein AO265_18070 [Pseudomonas sp. ABAC61]POA58301.1 hypothetical protein C1889_05430 [Pseudomonas sp. FW507-12TSA]UCZ85085.1 hypothetical protein LGQ10_01840 [Pseudomonas sp. L5B5]WMN15159.1 hypothetical protein QL104_17470 [Pseudomonas piscis]
MSRISIALMAPSTDLALVKFLHQRLGMSLRIAREHLGQGPQGVFYSAWLFHNDHVQREQEVRDILAFFGAAQLPLRVLECISDPDQAGPVGLDDEQIDEQLLLNLLEACDGCYE